MSKPAEQMSESLDHTKLKSSLLRAIDAIGRTGGHKLPPESSTGDLLLHQLYCANVGRKYFDGEYKRTLEEVLKNDTLKNNVENAPVGDEVTIKSEVIYNLNLKKNKPSSRVDVTKFINALHNAGVQDETIDAAKAEATTDTAPAKRFSIVIN